MKRLLVSVILKAVSVKGYFSYLLGLRIREQFLHSENDQVLFFYTAIDIKSGPYDLYVMFCSYYMCISPL